MSNRTYLEVVNSVLVELNEVPLTASTFSSAINIQSYIKSAVNRALYDINQSEYKWSFLSADVSDDPFLGNTYIETVAGTRWYLLKSTSTGIDDDYGFVDWEKFTLTTNGVAGESSPYVVKNLSPVSVEKWKMYLASSEAKSEVDSQDRGEPIRVIKNPDGRRVGLSPIPDKVYRVYFWAWNQLTPLVNHGDTFPFQDQYVYSVVEPMVRHYGWLFKENPQQAASALNEYKIGLRRMREQLEVDKSKKEIRDGRIRYI